MDEFLETLQRLLSAGQIKAGEQPYTFIYINHVEKIISTHAGSERRFIMSALDLYQANDAANYVIQVVVPYALGNMAKGSLSAMGKEAYEAVRSKAVALWGWVKGHFKDDVRLLATVDGVEGTDSDKPEFQQQVEYLHGDLATWLRHHPQALRELAPQLEELRRLLPDPTVVQSGDITMGDVSNATAMQFGHGSNGNNVNIIR